jgi:hypothetical protein
MGIAPEPPGDPKGVGRGVFFVWEPLDRGLTYLYVRISYQLSIIIFFINYIFILYLFYVINFCNSLYNTTTENIMRGILKIASEAGEHLNHLS